MGCSFHRNDKNKWEPVHSIEAAGGTDSSSASVIVEPKGSGSNSTQRGKRIKQDSTDIYMRE